MTRRLPLKVLESNPHRVLRFLVDVKHGACRMSDARCIVANWGALQKACDALERVGHVIIATAPPRLKRNGKPYAQQRPRGASWLQVTEAGRLWRHYLESPIIDGGTALQWHTRISTLEAVLKPFADIGKAVRDGADTEGPSTIAYLMAAEVLYPQGGGVVYPWSIASIGLLGSRRG